MSEIKISLEFSERTEQLLGLFLQELDQKISRLESLAPSANASVEAKAEKQISAPTPAECPFPVDEPSVEQTPAPAPMPAPAKEITLEEVRSKVMTLCRKGPDMKAAVKAVLNKYAESVTAMKPEQFGPFLADLEAI